MQRHPDDENDRTERVVGADDDIVARRHWPPRSKTELRQEFAGVDIPASLTGMLVAVGLLLILAGIAGAIFGATGFQLDLETATEEVSVGGLIVGLVVLFIAFLLGGWAAGRMARYDGRLNGLLTGVWFLVLGAILGVLGVVIEEQYDVLGQVRLPQYFSGDVVTTAAMVSGAIALVVILLGGWLGGRWGERFHRRADAALLRDTGPTEGD
jgi:hypothetical protein